MRWGCRGVGVCYLFFSGGSALIGIFRSWSWTVKEPREPRFSKRDFLGTPLSYPCTAMFEYSSFPFSVTPASLFILFFLFRFPFYYQSEHHAHTPQKMFLFFRGMTNWRLIFAAVFCAWISPPFGIDHNFRTDFLLPENDYWDVR